MDLNLNEINILQWNCNSYRDKYPELQLLISTYSPNVICLQETKLCPSNQTSFNNYLIYRNTNENLLAQYGVMIMIKDCLIQRSIPLTTTLQAVACSVEFNNMTICICCLYLPPSYPVNLVDLNDLFIALPQPFLLLGDFNGHSPLWGSPQLNPRGAIVQSFIEDNDLIILNNGSETFVSPQGHMTHIDISLCTQAIANDWRWNRINDLHSSDHFPLLIILDRDPPPNHSRRPRFIHDKADWDIFQQNLDLTQISLDQNINDIIGDVHNSIFNSAQACIPMTSIYNKRKIVPWWSHEIKIAIKERKLALRTFQLNPSILNLIEFKRKRALAKRMIREAKKKSWDDFRESIGPKITGKELWSKINCLSGKNHRNSLLAINVDNRNVTNPIEMCNLLAQEFCNNSCNTYLTPTQNLHKILLDANTNAGPVNQNDNSLNMPFEFIELRNALSRGNGKSPGPNKITYEIIKNIGLN